MAKKEAIIKQCGNYVQMYIADEPDAEVEAVAVYLYPELLKEIYKNEVPSFLVNDEIVQPRKLIGEKLVEQYMNNLTIYFEEPDAFDEELGILKLKELMRILLMSQNQMSIRQLLSEIFAPVNVKFKQAVEGNIFNQLSMEQLAFVCNMSLSTFKREFKRVYDETPARYIKRRRLDHAAKLLVSTDSPVSTIAYDCGFQDISTFSSVFHTQYNQSPSKYRLSQIG